MQRGFSEKAVSHHPPACHLALGIALVLGAACSDEAGAPGSPSSGGGSPAASGGSTSGGGGDTSVGGSSPATGGASTGGTGGTPGTGGSGATAAGGAPGSGGGATGGSSGAGATGGGSGGSGGDVPTAGACAGGVPDGRVMECLGRGVTAVPSGDGTFVSWRLFGTDPPDVAFNLYRQVGDGSPALVCQAGSDAATSCFDADGTAGATYFVRPVLAGVEGAPSEPAPRLQQDYLRIPLRPA
ncbi:MAG TPA: hypothetical protein VKZ49_06435, partial [Polyangiaceae bacterium]|nr:hypothetical protein [Polyangiaceae bacterium]